MEHEQLEEAVAAYAIGGLDEAERPEIEHALLEHLPGCASCREMLNDFREVAGDLALVAPRRGVPEAVEERILDGIREQRQVAAPRIVARRSLWGRVAVAAVAAAIVALGAWNVQLATRVHDANLRAQDLASAVGLIGAPDAKSASLFGEGGSLVLVWRPGRAVLIGQNVDAPASGNVLQVWLMRGGAPTSVGAFRPDNGFIVLPIDVDPMAFDRVAITVEKAPKSPRPTSAPIFSAPLSA